MPGQSSDCSPDKPYIWFCHQTSRDRADPPEWFTAFEARTLAQLEGPRRREYLSSRWLIRQSLSKVSGEAPENCQPVDGRPIASLIPEGWHLSLSHTRGFTAVAISRKPLGIDIESRQRKPNWQSVAKRWFTPVEQEWLLNTNSPVDFLKVWTLKEAWLKATQRGIAGNLKTLEVRENYELIGDQQSSHWRSCSCYVEGYLASLVYQAGENETAASWPNITLLVPPLEDFALTPSATLNVDWEPVLHRSISAKR
ncbi:4'-phosphopantetheinyl transferase superfamily protein [Marinobacter sp.]|uniref:4'-phosphopantetheinyl transferase family protein n=1 Tax=Marinobacter sp. TaxID=50741 RepID=UPI0035652E75